MEQSAGFYWLKNHYQLHKLSLKSQSYIGNNEKMELTSKGVVLRVFGLKYGVENNPINHIIFGLKFDYLNLHLLKSVFKCIPEREIRDFIMSFPKGIYTRKIGFLYEFLMRKSIDLDFVISGNYVDLLDEKKYIVGKTVKNSKWKINDNLLGTPDFCPIVRKTTEIETFQSIDISAQIMQLRREYSSDIFNRATNYLYGKETKSSYEIEHEKPSPKRIERFISLLMKAGTVPQDIMFEERNLTLMQNEIVDPRFAVNGYRDFQNYVGQSLPNYSEMLHYICPPPESVSSLMQGLKEVALKTETVSALVRASTLSFGFVFIHPFEDGNGRLHRFLIHDTLVRDKVVQDGLIIPVSAHILNNIKEYDAVLEDFSKELMQIIDYEKDDKGNIRILNFEEIESYYRFPDLTAQTSFLGKTIQETVMTDIPNELEFIMRYDELRLSIQEIVDMPDMEISRMILFLHQNKGLFPKRRRKDFVKLTDAEIELMEKEYQTIFEM
ncbi:Fic family protein [Flavobacterium aestuarii]|uniref:Fic family protein n=1 Tax=Flavobacterium aestuarii TaxID=3149227 RepID=UPI0032B39D2C